MSQAAGKVATMSPKSAKVADFNWEDPLDLESELTEEERMVRDTARGYAQDKLQPRVLTAYREERFDREIMSEMGARDQPVGDIAQPRRRRDTAARGWAMSPTG